MKTEFELEVLGPKKGINATVKIIGVRPESSPYVSIVMDGFEGRTVLTSVIQDHDLERLAVNILKALKSKKLKN